MSVALHIESYIPNEDLGTSKTRYVGEPEVSSALDSESRWTIYRFTYGVREDGTLGLAEIDVRHSVAWDDRETLDW